MTNSVLGRYQAIRDELPVSSNDGVVEKVLNFAYRPLQDLAQRIFQQDVYERVRENRDTLLSGLNDLLERVVQLKNCTELPGGIRNSIDYVKEIVYLQFHEVLKDSAPYTSKKMYRAFEQNLNAEERQFLSELWNRKETAILTRYRRESLERPGNYCAEMDIGYRACKSFLDSITKAVFDATMGPDGRVN